MDAAMLYRFRGYDNAFWLIACGITLPIQVNDYATLPDLEQRSMSGDEVTLF